MGQDPGAKAFGHAAAFPGNGAGLHGYGNGRSFQPHPIEPEHGAERFSDPAGPGCGLGIPSLCIKVFLERVSLQRAIIVLIYLAALAGLSLYYLFLLKDFGMVAISRYTAVSLALYLAFAYIPYFYRKGDFELYVIRLLLSFLVTYLYASILYAGLAAILLTTGYLFPVYIPEELYLDLWLITAGVLAPAFFLADIPGEDRALLPESYPRVLQVLLSYIVMPLILAYSLILYAYFALILVTAQWPELMVSHLVLWYAILATLVIFCLYPLRPANPWIRVTTTILPGLNLPLLAMMFIAMGIRINAYGFTENSACPGGGVMGHRMHDLLNCR